MMTHGGSENDFQIRTTGSDDSPTEAITKYSHIVSGAGTGPSVRCVCTVTKQLKLGSHIAKKLLTCRLSVCPMRVYCDKMTEVNTSCSH